MNFISCIIFAISPLNGLFYEYVSYLVDFVFILIQVFFAMQKIFQFDVFLFIISYVFNATENKSLKTCWKNISPVLKLFQILWNYIHTFNSFIIV